MPIVVNSNTTATIASFNLSHANDSLRKSLARLSSGKRIVQPSDDAGGMAVAYKLNSKLKRTEAVRQNVQNGIFICKSKMVHFQLLLILLAECLSLELWQTMSQRTLRT